MEFTENTKLTEIMEQYPELTEKLLRDEKIASLAASPLARRMLKTATLKDASRLSGEPLQDLIDELNRLTGQN